ncbi:FtsQ-type POTRA domain-containing protein [Actinopolymorpha sp. B9G3]|uniref:cell division protein FtsQ/DivIB n=1 Tax=Actinopolymorpha sp. B9G3 TaxID=3158970 RepID=UPI0032D9A235
MTVPSRPTRSRTTARTPPAGAAATVSASSARKFARRQWSRRLLRLSPALVLASVVVLAGLAVWAFGFSTLFDARTVVVGGLTPASGLSRAEVLSSAAVPLGRPLARIDLDAVRKRVAALPAVKGASVERSWPHEVRIEATCRTPVAVWRDGSVPRVVDAEGVAFRTAEGMRTRFVTIQTAARESDPERVAGLRQAGAQVAAALPAELRRRVETVRVRTVDSVTLHLDRGVTVMWGSADDSRSKARVLAALLKQRAKVYDVSVPGFPTTRT